jgi:ATP-dependent Clp protease protease subunit
VSAVPPSGERGSEPDRDPFAQLFARRSAWLRGTLDQASASRLCAELIALDHEGPDPIELIINSSGGPVDAALTVIDTLDLLAAPVATLCLGQAVGTAAAVLACGRGSRRATPTARLGLRLGSSEMSGTASVLRDHAEQLEFLRDQLAVRLATATGQLPAMLAIDLDEGHFMTADQAVGYGLIDEIATRR